MLEATVILLPTIPFGPVVSPGAAPSKDSSVPALHPTRRTSVAATATARTSTAREWLLDRLVTVNLPSCFLPSSLTPAAMERVIATGPGRRLVSWVRRLFALGLDSRSPTPKRQY